MSTAPVESRRVEYVPLEDLPSAPRNPKGHNRKAIRASIERFGFVTPAVVDERTGRLVVGHGRTEVLSDMREEGKSPPAGVRLDEAGRWLVPVLHGWSSRSDAEAEAYLVADNQLTLSGGWERDELSEILRDLDEIDPTLLAVTGFSDDILQAVLAGEEVDFSDEWTGDGSGGAGDTGDEGGAQDGDGALLELAGTSIGPPEFKVATGDVWRMGSRLVLVVANPHTEWDLFVPLLRGDALLFPYPSPMAALANGAQDRDVVFVQPNKHLAGWLLTKWKRVTGQHPTKADPS